MARLSSDIFPFVADYMRLVILLTDSFFSFFSLVNYSAAEPGGTFDFC
jgi:hypothetical protein